MSEKRYDARYGWQYRNHAGDMHNCPPPFGSPDDAVAFALERLQADDAWLSRVIDARAALEWAVRDRPDEGPRVGRAGSGLANAGRQ